ncbi:response regulator transcription factor [Mariniblastus fucicola]|uniref:Response regulator protein TmoT n=1 Tax=Mariniblastus fucicola TaxID=980251 RepID=A0A5B9P7Y1_9BACT|nr:response regulator [Mariniblastus fucicola]QEG21589.1 Response regulator protein TmoT [Mariniblastus fucicola]
MNDLSLEPVVYLVDDDLSVLRANRRLLRVEGWSVREFNSADEFLEIATAELLGCLILDYAMPDRSGLQLLQELRNRGFRIPAIMLTAHADWPLAVSAMKQGAIDFLAKPCPPDVLLSSVRAAVDRQLRTYQDDLETIQFRDRLKSLTPREHEVIKLVSTGMLNKQVATELGIVEKTVKVHRGRVMRKLELSSVAEMVQSLNRLRQFEDADLSELR